MQIGGVGQRIYLGSIIFSTLDYHGSGFITFHCFYGFVQLFYLVCTDEGERFDEDDEGLDLIDFLEVS